MRNKRKSNELNIPVTKQTAGGVTGAVLGGMVGGPVGAVVGGVAGAMVGEAAAEGKRPIRTAFEKVRSMARPRGTVKAHSKASARSHSRRKPTRMVSRATKSKAHASRKAKA